MRRTVGRRQLLGGLVAREITTRLAIVNVNVGLLVAAAVSLTVGHKRWEPPRRASDALLLILNAQSGTLRCGRVERHAASKALGRVVRHGVGLIKMRQGLKVPKA